METEDAKRRPPIAGYVQQNLQALRRARGYTVRGLSERLAELGVRLLPSGISKVEQGDRALSVDELVALAIALNVSPTRLLVPAASQADEPITLTPARSFDADDVQRWLDGLTSLPRSDAEAHEGLDGRTRVLRDADDDEAYKAQRPGFDRRARNHPLVRAVERLHRAATRACEGGLPHVELARMELERVRAELKFREREVTGEPAQFTVEDEIGEDRG